MNRRGFFRALLCGLAACVLPLPRGAGQRGTNAIFYPAKQEVHFATNLLLSGEIGYWEGMIIIREHNSLSAPNGAGLV